MPCFLLGSKSRKNAAFNPLHSTRFCARSRNAIINRIFASLTLLEPAVAEIYGPVTSAFRVTKTRFWAPANVAVWLRLAERWLICLETILPRDRQFNQRVRTPRPTCSRGRSISSASSTGVQLHVLVADPPDEQADRFGLHMRIIPKYFVEIPSMEHRQAAHSPPSTFWAVQDSEALDDDSRLPRSSR
ncbi:hypothetical protein B0H11DRAFT_695930 [Mycena galericulata]|nr:hypothetical protein B0H11DRAFT_695930 [Mycena galericulata]